MKVKITICKMGGGFKKAVIGQSFDKKDGEWYQDAVFGADDDELLARLKIRMRALNLAPLGRYA